MAWDKILEQFTQRAPVAVMQRVLLENILSAEKIDRIFDQHAEVQYQRELLFSTVVGLMSQVVCRLSSSPRAAYMAERENITVSLTSVYNKLQSIELQTSEALVRHVAAEGTALIRKCKGSCEPLLPGYRVRILDGNHLGKTNHRLKALRSTAAGALPGKVLAMLDPEHMVIDEIICTEDGHAQERKLLPRLEPLIAPDDLLIADRNFCTVGFLATIVNREAYFAIRQHSSILPALESAGKRRHVGDTETGEVYQEPVELHCSKSGQRFKLRRITVHLYESTRDNDVEVELLTNLPAKVKSTVVADLYRKRWKLEHAFNELTTHLRCEPNTLGYPKAALFAFAVAVCSYNLLAALKGVLRGALGEEAMAHDVSHCLLFREIQQVYPGMMVALPTPCWEIYQSLSTAQLAKTLKGFARSLDPSRYPKAPPQPSRKKKKLPNAARKHVATHRLLNPDEFR